jgi:hypothetical protein
VLIEYNPTIANAVHFVQAKDLTIAQGASAAALINLAEHKGYKLIAVTYCNMLFTTRELFGLFDIADNSLPAMRDDNGVPHVFVGYDGHIFLRDLPLDFSADRCLAGLNLRWHRLWLPESAVQLLPRRLQKFPGQYTGFGLWLYRLRMPQRIRRAVRRFRVIFRRLSSVPPGRANAI